MYLTVGTSHLGSLFWGCRHDQCVRRGRVAHHWTGLEAFSPKPHSETVAARKEKKQSYRTMANMQSLFLKPSSHRFVHLQLYVRLGTEEFIWSWGWEGFGTVCEEKEIVEEENPQLPAALGFVQSTTVEQLARPEAVRQGVKDQVLEERQSGDVLLCLTLTYSCVIQFNTHTGNGFVCSPLSPPHTARGSVSTPACLSSPSPWLLHWPESTAPQLALAPPAGARGRHGLLSCVPESDKGG